jgi:hypothetical protein
VYVCVCVRACVAARARACAGMVATLRGLVCSVPAHRGRPWQEVYAVPQDAASEPAPVAAAHVYAEPVQQVVYGHVVVRCASGPRVCAATHASVLCQLSRKATGKREAVGTEALTPTALSHRTPPPPPSCLPPGAKSGAASPPPPPSSPPPPLKSDKAKEGSPGPATPEATAATGVAPKAENAVAGEVLPGFEPKNDSLQVFEIPQNVRVPSRPGPVDCTDDT